MAEKKSGFKAWTEEHEALRKTVAAFATHIDEAELTADNRSGAWHAAFSSTCSSLPVKPSHFAVS